MAAGKVSIVPRLRSTVQAKRSTVQRLRATVNRTRSAVRRFRWTIAATRPTVQRLRSTVQAKRSIARRVRLSQNESVLPSTESVLPSSDSAPPSSDMPERWRGMLLRLIQSTILRREIGRIHRKYHIPKPLRHYGKETFPDCRSPSSTQRAYLTPGGLPWHVVQALACPPPLITAHRILLRNLMVIARTCRSADRRFQLRLAALRPLPAYPTPSWPR